MHRHPIRILATLTLALTACGGGGAATPAGNADGEADAATPFDVAASADSQTALDVGSTPDSASPVDIAASADSTVPGDAAADAPSPGGARWCSINSARCLGLLDQCPELTACKADPACALAAQNTFACICDGEQMGLNDGNSGACAQMHLGAVGTLSGGVRACFGNTSLATPACLVSVTPGCNDVQLVDPFIAETRLAQAAPTPSGGTIANGTYVLTELVAFTGPGGATGPGASGLHETLAIQGGTIEGVSVEIGVASSKRGSRESSTFQVAGASLSKTLTCRNGAALTVGATDVGYDATPTQLTLYAGSGRRTYVKK